MITRTPAGGFVLAALSAAFCLACSTNAQGQQEPPSIDVKFSATAEMPGRNVSFKQLPTEVPVVLFAADPALLNQKYVATITMLRPEIESSQYMRVISPRGGPANPRDSMTKEFWATIHDHSVTSPSGWSAVEISQLVKKLIERVPESKKPSAKMQAFLLNKQHYRVVIKQQGGIRGGGRGGFTSSSNSKVRISQVLQILGPDVETVSAASLALLKLFDHGLSLPIQNAFIKEMQENKAELPKMLAEYESRYAEYQDVYEQLSTFEPISVESIADLTTQKRLIAVEISGTQARIDACRKILEKLGGKAVKTTEQVEAIKITAEIELVGLTARKEAISKIIDDGVMLRELAADAKKKSSAVANLRTRIEREVRSIHSLENSRRFYLPIHVQGNEIQINPVKWEPGNNPSGNFGQRR